jgi:predicted kinase
MAILHLMVGLPCSGKSTRAKILEKEYNALLLTPDTWYIKLFGNIIIEATHDVNHSIIEKIMWDTAERVLTLGTDVILDFGFWAKEEREHFRSEAKRLGAGFKIHYMDVDEEELFKRLEKRNKELPEGVFKIPKEKMKEYVRIFQPVGDEELK